MTELGEWRWYCGAHEDDEEMCECASRAAAIEHGCQEFGGEQHFYVIEARIAVADEDAMGAGERDTAPFATTRGGEYVDPKTRQAAAPL